METKTDIFAACCADKDTRYSLSKPFVRDGYLCATDGKIAVRAPTDDPPSGKGPNVGELPWDIPVLGECDIPLMPEFTPPPCEHCKGTKKIKCDECDGGGTIECVCPCGECAHDVDCKSCDGTGYTDCECNEGFGDVQVACVFKIGDFKYSIAYKYARILNEYGVTKIKIPAKDHHPARFSGHGFEGMVMPLSPPRFVFDDYRVFEVVDGRWKEATDAKSSD